MVGRFLEVMGAWEQGKMNAALANYLTKLVPCAAETAVWANGTMPLTITDYLTVQLPPEKYITSVRCIVFQNTQLLVIFGHDDSKHILPGGRREPGETLKATGRREVLEETGWALGKLPPVGVRHFEHQSPCPPEHSYPCPHFLQLIFTATAVSHHPEAMQFDEWVTGSQFFPLIEVQQMPFSTGIHSFLNAATNSGRKASTLDKLCQVP